MSVLTCSTTTHFKCIPRAVEMPIESEVPPTYSSVWAMKMLPRTAEVPVQVNATALRNASRAPDPPLE